MRCLTTKRVALATGQPRQGRKNVAHGPSRGCERREAKPRRGERTAAGTAVFRPYGAMPNAIVSYPRLAPWATFFRRSAAVDAVPVALLDPTALQGGY